MNPNEEARTNRHIAKGDTCRYHSEATPPPTPSFVRAKIKCVCLQVESVAEVPPRQWRSRVRVRARVSANVRGDS